MKYIRLYVQQSDSCISHNKLLTEVTTCFSAPNTFLVFIRGCKSRRIFFKTAEKEKDSLLMKIKVMPPFCMLSQLVSLQPSEQSFQRREIT